jgi:hypothetical protein
MRSAVSDISLTRPGGRVHRCVFVASYALAFAQDAKPVAGLVRRDPAAAHQDADCLIDHGPTGQRGLEGCHQSLGLYHQADGAEQATWFDADIGDT